MVLVSTLEDPSVLLKFLFCINTHSERYQLSFTNQKVIILIPFRLCNNLELRFPYPLLHLLNRRIIMVPTFVRMFALNYRQSQLPARDKFRPNLLLGRDFNGEVEM